MERPSGDRSRDPRTGRNKEREGDMHSPQPAPDGGLFRVLVENAQDLICVLREDGTITFCSGSVRELLGYPPEELAGRSIFSFVHPDDLEGSREALGAAAARPGVTGRALVRLRHHDGSWRVHEVSSRNLLCDPGVRGLVVNSRDVTDRWEAERIISLQRDLSVRLGRTEDPEEALRLSLEAVIEASGMDSGGIYVLDEVTGGFKLIHHLGLSGDFVELIREYDASSPRAALVKAGEALYVNYGELPVPKEDAQLAEGIRAIAVVPIMHEGEAVGCVNLASHEKDEIPPRSRRALEAMLGHIGEALVRIRLRRAVSDSERHHRALVERSHDITLILDGEGRPRYHSPSLTRALGLPERSLEGSSLFDLVHPDDLASLREGLTACAEEGEAVRLEMRARVSDGAWRRLECICADLREDPAIRGLLVNARDITEQAEVERALAESRRAFETLLSNLPGMAYRCLDDPSWTMLFVSEGSTELTGYRPEDLTGDRTVSYADLIHPQDRDMVWDAVQEALASGEPFRLTYRIRTAAGEEKWVWEQGRRVGEDEGGTAVLEGFITDITERVRAEEDLGAREEAFRLLAENARDLIYRIRLRPERRFEYVSPSSTAITGYTPEDHYRDPNLGFKLVHPDDRRLLEEMASGALESGRPLEVRWVRRDGSVIWTEQVNTPVFDHAGELVAIEGIARDITDRRRAENGLRESEERYRATFESTGTAMGIIEADGTISLTNREFSRMVGMEKERIEGRMRYWDFVHPEDVARVRSIARKMMRGAAAAPLQYECRLLDREGNTRTVLVSVNRLSPSGKSVASLIDITEKKEYERRLEEYAGRMRDFMDIAAHELRHPATLLKGYAATILARRGNLSPEAMDAALRGIEVGADRLVYVVEELLDATRIQRGAFSLELEPTDVVGVAAEALREMALRYPERTFAQDLPREGVVTDADPNRLLRLFVILLDNAVKHSPAFQPVELQGRAEGGEIVFSVLDRGSGVPEGEGDKVFLRFYRVGGALRHGGPGLGLGLYIGRRIVEEHGGRIWHQPREGGGSVFSFTLPLGK
ncbi:MAG: PAS domain S-box protein [Actinobacteria bacterium]|nr:PAS domain S-box protein [Actinomycetota bacterium]